MSMTVAPLLAATMARLVCPELPTNVRLGAPAACHADARYKPKIVANMTSWTLLRRARGDMFEDQPGNVVEVLSGCPFEVEVKRNENVFLKIKRPRSDSELTFKWDWHGNKRCLLFYEWDSVPFMFPGEYSGWNHYVWQGGLKDEKTWYRDLVDFKDAYHLAPPDCGAAAPIDAPVDCTGADDPTQNTGFIYLTMHGYSDFFQTDPDGVAHGTLSFTWRGAEEQGVRPAQLAALKDLYYSNCKPTQDLIPVFDLSLQRNDVNRQWYRRYHMDGRYSTVQKDPLFAYRHLFNTSAREKDTDVIPFCDWMYDPEVEDAMAAIEPSTPCEEIPMVNCLNGSVVELHLSGRGLRGSLPDSFAQLTDLKRLSLSDNALEGPLPPSIFASEALEFVDIKHNRFTGEVPCPASTAEALQTVLLGTNLFTGSLPDCLFTAAPALQELDLSYLRLNSPIPPSIAQATQLSELFAEHAGLRGTLPVEMGCMARLSIFVADRNHLTGSVPQEVVDGWSEIYEIDLAFNDLSGRIPYFGRKNAKLRKLTLDHNSFSSSFEEQLVEFSRHQVATSTSLVNLGHNDLSGPLPEIFHEILSNAHSIKDLVAHENHFLCAPGTKDWPEWAFRVGTQAFGACTMPAKPTSAGEAVPGELLHVYGSGFEPSAELKCRLTQLGEARQTDVGASFVSEEHVLCELPAELPQGTSYRLSVANYGSDFSSAATLGDEYVPLLVAVPLSPPPPAPPPPLETDGSLAPAAVGAIVAAAAVALLALGFVICMVLKERSGNPMFAPLDERAAKEVVITTSLATSTAEMAMAPTVTASKGLEGEEPV